MKKCLLILVFGIIANGFLFSQSAQDTKDFIRENIDANDPLPNYDNFVFFENILKKDADRLAGKILSSEEFEHLFIYGRECHLTDNRLSGIWLTIAESVDIRGVTKITTTRNTGKNNFYSIKLYLSGKYFAKKYDKGLNENAKWIYLPQMEILIGDNSTAVKKIKKAIIHLGKIYNVDIKDGDLF